MINVFSQAAEISIKTLPLSERLKKLPLDILKHTDWEYFCEITDKGCFLRPTFRNMPYKNSFVPEIDVVVSKDDNQTVLHITGKPVKFVRIFTVIFFILLLIIEVLLLALIITSNLNSIFPLFIPIGVCAIAFLFCKIGTAITFKSVVKAIRKEVA